MLSILEEPEMPSARAVQSRPYENQGLADAAIATVALEHKCAVLTDDLDLYIARLPGKASQLSTSTI